MKWESYLNLNDEALRKINSQEVSAFFSVLDEVRSGGGTIWVVGNGGSASAASHAVADFGKTAKSGGARPLFTIAPSEMTSMQTAYSNDISFESGYAQTIRDFARSGDAVWIISVSGRSPNLLAVLDVARDLNLRTLSTVGTRGGEMAALCESGIVVPSEDYQVVENAHIILMHWFTKLLSLR